MARLRSLNLRLKFHTSYKTHPVTIKHLGKSVSETELNITRINQNEQIHFEGFTPQDTTQKVTCTLEYNNREVYIQSITSFQMQDNQYVANTVINNCKEVHFNGRLDLKFSKSWFKHNILAGANLDDNYIHWDQVSFADEEVFCVGDSFTFGHGVARHETWPSMLDPSTFNFGSKGLSHDGCLYNIRHILKTSKYVKKIISLLPSPSRKLYTFDFLGYSCATTVRYDDDSLVDILPTEYSQEIRDTQNLILDAEKISRDWIITCTDIIDLCNEHKIECWLSTWDHLMYEHIPKKHRLPAFPDLKTFKDRASDNAHPHRKHYELFVKNIKPYIDKTQS